MYIINIKKGEFFLGGEEYRKKFESFHNHVSQRIRRESNKVNQWY